MKNIHILLPLLLILTMTSFLIVFSQAISKEVRQDAESEHICETKTLGIVTFKDDNGDKLKGKVVLVFTSLQGNQCVHINNFATTRLLKDITKA